MPEAQWKRPALFVLGLVGALGFGWFAWNLRGHAQSWVIVPLLSVLVLASAFGLLVAVNGCAACVARLFWGRLKAMRTRSNMSFNTDAQMRPLPSVAPGLVRRLPSR
jgi:hypothetical protein